MVVVLNWLLSLLPVYSQMPSEPALSRDDKQILEILEGQYRRAAALEEMRLFPEAREIYDRVADRAFEKLQNRVDSPAFDAFLPVLSSAVFRLSVVTSRDNYANVHQLALQIEDFGKVQTDTDRLIVWLQSGRRPSGANGHSLVSSMLFARAYNRISWANKMLEGIAWKNYVVMPPSDIIGMVEVAVADLDQILRQEQVPSDPPTGLFHWFRKNSKTPSYDDYSQGLAKQLVQLGDSSSELRSLRMMNLQDDPQILSRIIAKRYFYQAYEISDYRRSAKVKDILADSKSRYTLESILSSKNKALFDVMDDLVQILGIRSF
jgi:hypothetical protein